MLKATQATATATVAMAGLASLQLLLFFWQLRLMRRSVDDAKESAWAAKSAAESASVNAKAIVDVELPVIIAAVDGLLNTPRKTDPYIGAGGGGNDAYPTKYSMVGPIYFKNFGRTPAFLKYLELGWMATDKLPEKPRYEVVVSLKHFSIIAPDGKEFEVPYYPSVELTEEEQEAVSTGASKLWVFGSLHYTDFLGNGRQARFCFHYDHRPRGILNGFGFFNDTSVPPDYTRPVVEHYLLAGIGDVF